MSKKSKSIRLFFGLPIAINQAKFFRKRILNENPELPQNLRWTREEDHHITVHFLGNIPEEKMPMVTEAVAQAIKNIKPFDVSLHNISKFPSTHGRFIAVNVVPSIALQRLHGIVNETISLLEFPLEKRPYLPHVTLIKLGRRQDIDFDPIALDDISLTMDNMALYQTVPTEKGNIYVPIKTFYFFPSP